MAPITTSGIEIGDQEWRNMLFIWYGMEPPYLTQHCDCCGEGFTVTCNLDCKKDGLFADRYNKLCGWVADLECKSLTPTHMSDDPFIIIGHAVRSGKDNQDRNEVPNK